MMLETLFERTRRLLVELIVQIVPPALLAGFAANEIARATGITFFEAAGLVSAGLLVCLMFHMVRN